MFTISFTLTVTFTSVADFTFSVVQLCEVVIKFLFGVSDFCFMMYFYNGDKSI